MSSNLPSSQPENGNATPELDDLCSSRLLSHMSSDDESFPQLPPPMPTLDELRKKQSSSSTSARLPSTQLHPMSNLDQFRPPPCKKRKLRLNSSFFDDINPEQPILHPPPPMPKLKHLQDHLDPRLLYELSNLPASSKPASSKSPSSQDQMDSRLLHESPIHEAGVTASTPESVGGYFLEFFPDVALQNHPSPILSDTQRAAKLPSSQPASNKSSSSQQAPILSACIQQALILPVRKQARILPTHVQQVLILSACVQEVLLLPVRVQQTLILSACIQQVLILSACIQQALILSACVQQALILSTCVQQALILSAYD